MDIKSVYWAWAIKNSICVVAWVVLAVMFNKWWIALFSVLFMSDLKIKTNPNDALKFAEENGWTNTKVGDKWEDYCPECQDREV